MLSENTRPSSSVLTSPRTTREGSDHSRPAKTMHLDCVHASAVARCVRAFEPRATDAGSSGTPHALEENQGRQERSCFPSGFPLAVASWMSTFSLTSDTTAASGATPQARMSRNSAAARSHSPASAHAFRAMLYARVPGETPPLSIFSRQTSALFQPFERRAYNRTIV